MLYYIYSIVLINMGCDCSMPENKNNDLIYTPKRTKEENDENNENDENLKANINTEIYMDDYKKTIDNDEDKKINEKEKEKEKEKEIKAITFGKITTIKTYQTKNSNMSNSIQYESFNNKDKQKNNQTIDNTSYISNKFYLKGFPIDYEYKLLEYINQVRQTPYLFANNILDYISHITKLPNMNQSYNLSNISNSSVFYFIKENECKVELKQGKQAFIDSSEELIKLDSTLCPLRLNQKLSIEIPDDRELWCNKDYLEREIQKKFDSLDFEYIGFHFDFGIVNPLISVILQVVDDNNLNFQRRNNILNENFKYLGISIRKINNSACTYFTFAG